MVPPGFNLITLPFSDDLRQPERNQEFTGAHVGGRGGGGGGGGGAGELGQGDGTGVQPRFAARSVVSLVPAA